MEVQGKVVIVTGAILKGLWHSNALANFNYRSGRLMGQPLGRLIPYHTTSCPTLVVQSEILTFKPVHSLMEGSRKDCDYGKQETAAET